MNDYFMRYLLTRILYAENYFVRKPIPLLHAFARSEGGDAIAALLESVHELAACLSYTEISIQAVGMDHSQASMNAAKAAGAACVVDCSVHVD